MTPQMANATVYHCTCNVVIYICILTFPTHFFSRLTEYKQTKIVNTNNIHKDLFNCHNIHIRKQTLNLLELPNTPCLFLNIVTMEKVHVNVTDITHAKPLLKNLTKINGRLTANICLNLQEHNLTYKLISTLNSKHSAWQQAAKYSLLQQFALSRVPHFSSLHCSSYCVFTHYI